MKTRKVAGAKTQSAIIRGAVADQTVRNMLSLFFFFVSLEGLKARRFSFLRSWKVIEPLGRLAFQWQPC